MAIFTAIGTAVAAALFAGSTLAAALITTGLTIAANMAYAYLTRPKARKYSAIQGSISFGADVPCATVFGTSKVKGHRIYYAKFGKGNKYNSEVFILANGWCDGLEPEIHFYGEKHALLEVAVSGNEIKRYHVADFDENIIIRFYDGRPGQAIDQKLVDDTADLDNPWKQTSRLSGLCYVVIERKFSQGKFKSGRPEFDFILRGLRLYDPRLDSTVSGGAGPHRVNDPSTFVHSKNPAIIRINFRLGIKGLVSGRTMIGLGDDITRIDLPSHIAAANVCDQQRTIGLKTFNRYECNLYVTAEDDHLEILQMIEDAMAGFAANRAGLSGVIAGAPQVPVLTITDLDIRSDEPQSYKPRKSAFESVNILSGQFTSPASNWNAESLKTIEVNADIAADGRKRPNSNDFLQVTDPDIAQYLLQIRYRQNRKAGAATLPVSRRIGAKMLPGDWVTYASKTWMVSRRSIDSDFRFTVALSQTGSDIYDESEIPAGPVIVPPVNPVNPSLISRVENFSISAGSLEGGDGSRSPALMFSWDPPDDETIEAVLIYYQIEFDPDWQVFTAADPEAGQAMIAGNIAAGKIYVAYAVIQTNPDRFVSQTPIVSTLTATISTNVVLSQLEAGITQSLANLRSEFEFVRDQILD